MKIPKQATTLEELRKNVGMVAEKKHHKYSPSSFPAWASCPYWERVNRNFSSASRGTMMHEAFRAMLIKNQPIGHIIGAYSLAPRDVEELEWACDYVKKLLSSSYFTEGDFEKKVSYRQFGSILFSGSVDLNRSNILFDLKTGKESDYEKQIEAYSLAYMQELELQDCMAILLFTETRNAKRYHFKLDDSCFKIEEIVEKRRQVKEFGSEAYEKKENSFCMFCKFGKSGDKSCPSNNNNEIKVT